MLEHLLNDADSSNPEKFFPFPLDDFQLEAIAALDAGKSVVVCAPTGAGKTLIGEYTIYRALSRGRRIFYTTPLKALSNQKLRDFRERFGAEKVGLVTGDVSINREAPILVMTTEIFRNMLYGTPIGEIGTSLVDVEAVVLDECHYMNDRQRGTVWEESIIYCPREIQLVALSATVANSDQLTDWISKVHGDTELIWSNYRPVPLEYHFCTPKGLFPLLDSTQTKINPILAKSKKHSEKDKRPENKNLAEIRNQLRQKDYHPTIYFNFSRQSCERAVLELDNIVLVNQAEEAQIKAEIHKFISQLPREPDKQIKLLLEPLIRGVTTYHGHLIPEWRSLVARLFQQGLVKALFVVETVYAVKHLQQRDMLPAIYFIFSRNNCDLAVAECDRAVKELGLFSLVNQTEISQLKLLIDEFLERNPEAGRANQIEPLYRGIAAHHAGILPAWKSLVEELFQAGLIKVVFATETLAAGINMPARTTVISSLSKRTDDGHRLLNASEFLQMAGRAGRRGMDKIGHVVTVQTPFEGAKEAAYLATSEANRLVSQFTPSYGMVLNLLQTHSIEDAKNLVERSFGQYLATLYLKPEQAKINKLKTDVGHLEAQIAGIDWFQLRNYEELYERYKTAKRELKDLQKEYAIIKASDLAAALPFAIAGTILSLKGRHIAVPLPLRAVLVKKVPGSGQYPYLVCLGQDNRWYVATNMDVVGLHGEIPRLSAVDYLTLPEELPLRPGPYMRSTEATLIIVNQIPQSSELDIAPEVKAQQERAIALQKQLENHPIHEYGNPKSILKRLRRIEELHAEIEERQTELDQELARHWQEFLALIAILQDVGGLEGLQPTPIGEAAAAIRGDNELWLGLVLMSRELDELDPHHFAAACAAIATEVSRPDCWTSYKLSEQVKQALGRLWGLRKRLIKNQKLHGVVMPVWPEKEEQSAIFALVEQWALGLEWTKLCENTSLDEGDVVRILRRTLDFLSQVPHVPHLSTELRRNALRAIQLMDRFPVNEIID